MHCEYAKTICDAVYLREGQQVLMPTGRAATVTALRHGTVLFRYLDTQKHDEVELTRQQVSRLVGVAWHHVDRHRLRAVFLYPEPPVSDLPGKGARAWPI
ncbi:hypothetical protein [Paludibacterium paludis]|uniref:Uncharacterized protein n=1 Tax=Paludibacterium paludis TaxID=1225769 RepID=A0A918NZA4_9NEIS|nr:hypothetical protein [Paludibacterium paludis]GGY07137.1 hypothetical protein GCM10011289_07180 [Paludibacterium paludis]